MALRKSTRITSATAAAPVVTASGGRLLRKRNAAAVQPGPTAAETEKTQLPLSLPAELAPTNAVAAIEPLNTVNALALPPLDAPAVNTDEPAISYKIDFANKSSWFASLDGGATKTCIESNVIAGCPVDLALQISRAKGRDGFDQRLRLAFMEAGPTGAPAMAEINCNAINVNRDGDLYVTSSGRSLAGALLAISEAEDDMAAFCAGARFRLRPGTGRGVFIEVDIAQDERWIAMSSPSNTNRIAKDAAGFHNQLALIKSRFRSCGLLLTAAAVIGELESYDSEQRSGGFAEIPVLATPVQDETQLS